MSRRPTRRTGTTLSILAVGSVGVAPLMLPGNARADDPSASMSGQAQAVFARLVPYLGLPGVATSLGITTAQVGSGTAQSSAGAADFGLIGAVANSQGDNSGKAPAFALPEPVSADSQATQHVERDPFAPPGSTAPTGPAPAGGAYESATATKTPLAALGIATGPSLDLPGVLTIAGGSSTSSVANGISSAEVTIARMSLGGGQVVLSGLRWSAVNPVGKPAVPQFALSAMTVAGQSLPVAGPDQLGTALEAANKALDPFGLALSGPANNVDATGAGVGPLTLQFRSPQALVDPTTQASTAAKPAITALADQVLKAYPDASAAQLATNAVLGASSGRSGGRLELGGVSVRSATVDLAGADPSAVALPALPPTPGLPVVPDGAASSVVPSVPAAAPEVAPDAVLTTAGAPARVATRGVSYHLPRPGGRGVAVLALGLGLLALLVLAAVDRLRAG